MAWSRYKKQNGLPGYWDIVGADMEKNGFIHLGEFGKRLGQKPPGVIKEIVGGRECELVVYPTIRRGRYVSGYSIYAR